MTYKCIYKKYKIWEQFIGNVNQENKKEGLYTIDIGFTKWVGSQNIKRNI
jgi:hypothetical protein